MKNPAVAVDDAIEDNPSGYVADLASGMPNIQSLEWDEKGFMGRVGIGAKGLGSVSVFND